MYTRRLCLLDLVPHGSAKLRLGLLVSVATTIQLITVVMLFMGCAVNPNFPTHAPLALRKQAPRVLALLVCALLMVNVLQLLLVLMVRRSRAALVSLSIANLMKPA